jgi:opacity protein-like surface antigen
MNKLRLSLFIPIFAASGTVYASWSPVIELYAAETWVQWDENYHVDLEDRPGLPLPPDRYAADSSQEEAFGWGAMLGVEWNKKGTPWYLQGGITYDYVTAAPVDGEIYVIDDPNRNNFAFSYNVQHQRVGLALKGLWKCENWFPYIEGGVGQAWNRVTDYEQEIISPTAPFVQPVTGETHRDFSYTLGAGLERGFGKHWRVGLGYAYTDAGKIRVENENTAKSANANNIQLQQILLSINYIG